MSRLRFRGLALALAGVFLAAATAFAAIAVDSVVALNGTATGEVSPGGRPTAIGVLVPNGTAKGSLTVKAVKGSLLAPRVSLAAPDGTVKTQDDLAALGAVVKVTPKSVSIKNLPVFTVTGLYKVIVAGVPGTDGKPTAGGFTMKLAGKPLAAFVAPPSSIGNVNEKDDYSIDVPQNALLSVVLKPSKLTPFGVTLKILAPTGDEFDFGPYAKVGTDDSITIKNYPMPTFGRFTLRVGSKAATGDYTLSAKFKVNKKPLAPVGAPVADAGGPYFLEPSTKGNLDGSGTTNATSWVWVPVSGPALSFGNKVVNPTVTMPATRATYAWQLVAKNSAGSSLPSLCILEVDRAPVADAGPGAAIASGSVDLDGSRSVDLDAGETLYYEWTQVAGATAAIDDRFAQQPTVTPGSTGPAVFSLVVHDGVLPSTPSLVVVNSGNSGAAADAGRTIVVRPQDTVYLSGLRSRKADGTAPTQWAWSALGSNPAAVTLAGADGPVASFTAPKQAMTLGFRLAVEGDTASADEVSVVVTNGTPLNPTPVANAGGPLSPATGAGFSLFGTGSSDDGSVQSHEWMQVEGDDADLLAAGSATATATAPGSAGVLRFLLMVHDGRKYGAPDSALVAVGGPAAPVASAGPDRAGSVGATLNLTSAASVPAPGQTITAWQWTQLSGKDWYDVDAVDGLFDPASPNPSVKVPTTVSSLSPTRTLHFGLKVTDSTGTSREDYVAVVFQNLPKNAAPQLSASTTAAIFRPGATVALSSTASDPDGDALSYSWTQVSGPAAAIGGSTLPNASITAPIASGTLVYRVAVTDNTGEPNGTVTADVIFDVNRPPVANAVTTPASGPAGTLVTLNGSTSSDPDDVPTYAWTEIPPVSGGPVTLSGQNTHTATFTMPAYSGSVGARRRTFRLTVTDAMGPSFAVTKDVTFNPNQGPSSPSVTAGGDRKVFYSDSAATSDKTETLSIGATSDPDGDPLTFTWTVESGPITSTSVLLSATSGANITFKSAPKPSSGQVDTGGVYVIGVVSSDGVEQSTKTTIEIVVTASWQYEVHPLIQASCGIATTGCHSNVAAGGGLILNGGLTNARAALLNGRVTPNNYQSSSFWAKMNDGSMPKGQSRLPQHIINLSRDWIEPEYNANPKPGLSNGAEQN